MDYPKLKVILDDRLLLEEEIKMWLRVGMYITTEPKYISGAYFVKMYDGEGHSFDVNDYIGKNIRKAIMNWWQIERIKPRALEPVDNTGLVDLEVQRG